MSQAVISVSSILNGHPGVIELLARTGAVLEGHFELSQGSHSDIRIEMDLALANVVDLKSVAQLIAWEIAKDHLPIGIDGVIGPASWGDKLATLVARYLGGIWDKELPVIHARKKGPSYQLVYEDRVTPTDLRWIVIDDVYTTGRSIDYIEQLVRQRGGTIVDRYVIACRRGDAVKSLVSGHLNHWDAKMCPLTVPLESSCSPVGALATG